MRNLSRKLALDDTYGIAATAYENNPEFTLSAKSGRSRFFSIAAIRKNVLSVRMPNGRPSIL